MAVSSPLRAPRWLAVLLTAVCALGLVTWAPLAANGATTNGPETRPFEPEQSGEAGTGLPAPRSNAPSHVPAANVPRVDGLPVTSDGSKVIEGLSLADQRTAAGGNSFSLEPPDQALCVGGSVVIEGVNNVFATYSKTGGRLTSGPQSYDPFWNDGAVEVDRTADPPTFGPFVSDPKCYFDPGVDRFFMTELELGTDPATGDFNGDSYVNIAVSRTATPTTSTADWLLYQLDVANDGGTDTSTGAPAGSRLASHPECPCLGDQPLIGADRYGFYVSTNEFPIFADGFNGAQIYAFDKAALAAGRMKVQRIESSSTPLAEGVAYSVQPATSPVASEWSTAANGTEYALSALEFTSSGADNRIATWAFTNTASLTTPTPDVRVSSVIVDSEVYRFPPKVAQKAGPYPLGQSLKDKLNLLDSNDDRMNQTVFAGGRLWSGVNTAVKTQHGPTTVGIAYFVVRPTTTGSGTSSSTSATMANQGYVAVDRQSVFFPSIGVTAGAARAAMVFTLAGRGYYPSTAYVRLTSTGAVTGPVTVYAAGTKPADGFTGYPEYGGNGVERWGGYSAAVADTSGTIWMAAEYIPGTFGYPEFIANWGTAVGAVR